MIYICESCDAELDDDIDPIMLLKKPEGDPLAYCLSQVDCAEEGADAATDEARKLAREKKPDAPPKPNEEGAD